MDKIKSKHGGTHIMELLICTPIIICILFMPVAIYQLLQQENHIEDVKTAMTQAMSRDGQLTTSDINKIWKPAYEKMNGITIKSITPINTTVKRESNSLMTVEIVATLKPSLFSFLFGGEYKTKAIIYSEYVGWLRCLIR